MDEHRLGLKPILRREWVDEFSDATAKVNWRFQWLWLYGFVHPSTGETYWWILPFVNNELFERVLKDFAQHFQIDPKKRVVLVMDGAGWHLSKSVKIPKGIHLYCLPSHSPELQPAERLWPLTNEPIANRYFSSLDEAPSCFIPTVSQTLRSQTINLRFDSFPLVAGTKSFINVRPRAPTRLF